MEDRAILGRSPITLTDTSSEEPPEIQCKNLLTMPRLNHRIIYDDDGEPMKDGSQVLVNGKHKEIIHFNRDGEIEVSGWSLSMEEIETIEHLPDDRFGVIEDDIIESNK